ncbi:glucose-1-phosphate adenylyltransferase [Bacillus sp. FJAT-27225]|uniref:sugar phosphate nucleotidyltransferase n=1 Tax=Bacillus sp. FJAT-27225 TaxID=1743144 RepID=UPI00080C20C7|nr:sugar phosphate nucleotidyltransferase [Bacillus sp. FJAT-27225]OCA91476.1 glucose-1-phosphate adenylyltransferase [Bacillus sp. FJAT-27225]
MLKQLLGVIDAAANHENLQELLLHRPVAALPFAGRYRLIDFVLSSMVNSGIRSVAVFPKTSYRSLMDHLGSGKNWDLNRKRDGLFFFPPMNIEEREFNGTGCLAHFEENIDFFYRSSQEYTLLSNSNTVINEDFRPFLKAHLRNNCDITEVYKNGKPLNIYLLKTSLLIELIENRQFTGYTSLNDVVDDFGSPYTICRYEFDGYAEQVDSVSSYYRVSMDLLKTSIWGKLFKKEQPVFTKVKDEPPSHYYKGASVKKALLANGCQVRGMVENSIISRGVTIGEGAVVRNSIIMQKSQIGENCILESVILDKDVKVEPGTILIGTPQKPIVYGKGSIIKPTAVPVKSLLAL